MHLFHTAVEKPVDNLTSGDFEPGKYAITKRVLIVEKTGRALKCEGVRELTFA